MVTRFASGGPRLPRLATTLASHGSHNGLTLGSVALHFVSARNNAADSDKTSGLPGYSGVVALATLPCIPSLAMCKFRATLLCS
ncbi:hypothetical protein CCP3SC1_1450003 [Gammaproteobacteria bacterium]